MSKKEWIALGIYAAAVAVLQATTNAFTFCVIKKSAIAKQRAVISAGVLLPYGAYLLSAT